MYGNKTIDRGKAEVRPKGRLQCTDMGSKVVVHALVPIKYYIRVCGCSNSG